MTRCEALLLEQVVQLTLLLQAACAELERVRPPVLRLCKDCEAEPVDRPTGRLCRACRSARAVAARAQVGKRPPLERAG